MSKEGVSLAKWPKLGVGHEGGDGPTAVALTLSFELWEKGARVFFAGPMSSSPFPVLIHSCVSDRSQHIRLQIDEIGEGALGELRRYREALWERFASTGILFFHASGTVRRMGGREPGVELFGL